MQNKNADLHVLIIVNRLHEWSQNFITRELTALNQQGLKMHIATRIIVRRDDLTEQEKMLLPFAFLLPENPFLPGFLIRHVKTKLHFFKGYLRAWQALFLLKHKPSKFFRSVVCLFRAASVAEWVVSQKINLIHAHFLTAPGDTALYLSRITGIPYGGTAHAMDIYTDNSGLTGKIAHAAYLTTCTAANEIHLKSLPGVNPDKIHKLYHGIEIGQEEPRPENHQPFTFIAVGRMVEKKGFKFLIEACSLLQKQGLRFQLNFIGNGPLEKELKAQMHFHHLSDCVYFKGIIPPNNMGEQYQQADVLVMPSVVEPSGDRDGLPNVCLEAMNYGLPIIGSHVSGIPEGVVHGKNGWLVPPGDVEKLAEAMAEAIQTNSLFDMKKAVRRMVIENFSLENNIRALRQLMENAATLHSGRQE
jgi:glycosyltransferase involved in cell wall biosynthesis